MNLLRILSNFLLPPSFRDYLRGLHRKYIFWKAMNKFMKAPETCIEQGHPVLKDLIYGWGNETWSALDDYLVGCASRAIATPGPILECGSGLSTIVVGTIAKKYNKKLWTLEHAEEWTDRLQKYLIRYEINSVILLNKPLVDFGDFVWYDVSKESLPKDISLIICDGPPGTTKGGRYGLVPVIKPNILPGCVILLDDVDRKEEFTIASRWQTELNASLSILGQSRHYAEMRIMDGKRLVKS